MAYQLATAYVQIVPSMKGVGKAISDAFDKNSQTAGLKGGQSAGTGFASGLKAKMGAVIGVASAITTKAMNTISGSIGSAVARADQMNNFPKVMQNLGYSSEDAAKSIKKISDSLDGLPTTSSAMTGMVQQLAPLTSSLDEATTISLAFNNAMLAGGASTMEQENALAQYTQMLAAGKVDMAAWKSIQAAMPGQLNQVAEAMLGAGKNGNDLYEAMKDGTVSFDDFNKAIVDLNENGFGQYASFAQQAKDATQGIGTAFENVQNRVAKAIQKVIEAIGVEQIAGAINDFSSQFGKVGDAAADMVTRVKDQIGKMAQRLEQNDAIAGFIDAWKTATDAIGGIDWAGLLPSNVWEGFMQTAAQAIGNVSSIVHDLAGRLADAVQWVQDFVGAFNSTGAWDAWIDAFGQILDLGNDLWDAFGNIIDRIGEVTGLTGGAQSFGETLGNAFKSIGEAVQPVIDALDDIVNWCGQHADAVITAMAGIAGAFGAFKATQGIQTAVDALGKLNGPIGDLKAAFDLIGETGGLSNFIKEAGGLSGALGMLPGKVGQLAGTFNTLKGSSTGVMASMKALSGALGMGPWGLLATAIGAVVSALVWFFTQTELGQKIWQGFVDWLGTAWQWLCDTATSVFGALGDFFSSLWDGIKSTAENVWNGISSFFTGLWDGIKSTAENVWDGISNAFTTAWNAVSGAWDAVWNGIKTVFEAIWAGIQAYVNNVIMPVAEFIKNCFIVLAAVFVTIWNNIKMVWETVWNAIVAFVTPIIETVRAGIEAFVNGVKETWDTVWQAVSDFFQTIWQAIVDFVTPIIETIQSAIETAVNAVKDTWDSVWGAIRDFFQQVWDAMVAFYSPIIENIRATIETAVNTIKGVWDSVWGAIKSFFETVWNGMKSTVSSIVNAIRDTISNVVNSIKGTWENIWNGIKSFFENIWNGMKDAVSNAIGWIGNKVSGIKDTIMDALSGAGEWLFSVGEDLIQGLINGIGNMFNWVKDKIFSLGDNILGWAKGVLGIGSPSRIFKQYGQWLDEGLALGIGDASGTVQQEIDALGNLVTSASFELPSPGVPQAAYPDTPPPIAGLASSDSRNGGMGRQDIAAAISQALADGITLLLNDRGSEVMAGQLAKPMSVELAARSRLGR